MIWGSLSLYYHTCSLLSHNPPSIFTLYASPVDSHGGYAWVATFYLFGSFSPRDWDGDWGFAPTRHYGFSLFLHIFTSVYLHSLRFAGLFLRRLCLGCHFLSLCYSFTFFIISHFSLIYYKIEPFILSSPYFTFRISNVIRTGPHDALLFVVL
jgi:hypothetical protein